MAQFESLLLGNTPSLPPYLTSGACRLDVPGVTPADNAEGTVVAS